MKITLPVPHDEESMNDKQKRLFGLVTNMLARHCLNGEELAPSFMDHGEMFYLNGGAEGFYTLVTETNELVLSVDLYTPPVHAA